MKNRNRDGAAKRCGKRPSEGRCCCHDRKRNHGVDRTDLVPKYASSKSPYATGCICDGDEVEGNRRIDAVFDGRSVQEGENFKFARV